MQTIRCSCGGSTKGRALIVVVVAMAYLFMTAGSAYATFEFFFDENGNGRISQNGGPITPLAGVIAPDPASGMPALTYFLPELVINGDVAVVEPGGQTLTDGLRFTNAQGQLDHNLVTADRMIYFSEQPGTDEVPPFDLADTGFGPNFGAIGFNGTLTEVGPENHNGFDWFPGGNIYHGISDVPEPGTLTLLGIGALAMVGCAWRRRKQVA